MIEPAYISIKQLAEYLSISESTARKMVASGEAPSVKVSGSIRIPKALLDEKLEAHTTGGKRIRRAP